MKNRKTNSFLCADNSSFSKMGLLGLHLAICISMTLSACYEPIEGCLDPNAVNFTLDADQACLDCCTYPELSVQFVHLWEDADTSFTFQYQNNVYEDGGGATFLINRLTYYLSAFSLQLKDGTELFTSDTVLVSKLTGGSYEPTYIRDDYLLLSPITTAAQDIGALSESGTFTQLQFQLGVDTETDLILPSSLSTNHPLSLLDSSMYDQTDGRYLSSRLETSSDTSAMAVERTITYGSEINPVTITVDIPGEFTLAPGFDLNIVLAVNYAEWFKQVQDINTNTSATVINQTVSGMPFSFSLLEISGQ